MKKYATTAAVCKYVQDRKQISSRSIAKMLSIHHTTWLRYKKGTSQPGPGIKYKLVVLMKEESFEALIQKAFRRYYPAV